MQNRLLLLSNANATNTFPLDQGEPGLIYNYELMFPCLEICEGRYIELRIVPHAHIYILTNLYQ